MTMRWKRAIIEEEKGAKGIQKIAVHVSKMTYQMHR
jgi:hypothetical protein